MNIRKFVFNQTNLLIYKALHPILPTSVLTKHVFKVTKQKFSRGEMEGRSKRQETKKIICNKFLL